MVSQFKLKDEKTVIYGNVYTPEGDISDSVIILSHEFGMNMLSAARYAKKLCKAGFKTYIFDFLGSGAGKSKGRKSTEMSVLTECEDLTRVLDYVKEQEPNRKIILGGCSQGGFVSALLAAKRNHDVEKLFLLYPAFCIPDDARRGCIIGKKIDTENIPEKFTALGYVKLGRKYVEEARSLEPWREIENFSKPVLILHGDHDGIVPLSYSEKAEAVYSNSELYIYRGAGHVFPRKKDVDRAVSNIVAFINGYKEALTVDVKITGIKLRKNKLLISFGGNSVGEHFKGKILDGAVDTWIFKGLKCISKKAEYTITADTGNIHIVNADVGNGWTPLVTADKPCGFDFGDCYAIVKQRTKGPLVRIFARKQ